MSRIRAIFTRINDLPVLRNLAVAVIIAVAAALGLDLSTAQALAVLAGLAGGGAIQATSRVVPLDRVTGYQRYRGRSRLPR